MSINFHPPFQAFFTFVNINFIIEEMVWQTVPVFDDSHKEGVLSKCLVDFRADHLPFERVMTDFRKNIVQTDFEGKNRARKFLGRKISCTEKNISLMAYNAEKRSYSAICW